MLKKKKCTFVRIPPYFGLLFSHPQERQLPLNIASAAAYLQKEGWEVQVIDQWVHETSVASLTNRFAKDDSAIYCFHVDSLNHEVVEGLAHRIYRSKPNDVGMIAFGQLAEVMPEKLMAPGGDFHACIYGEIEETLAKAADALFNKRSLYDVAGISFFDWETNEMVRTEPRALLEDVDELPFPAYELFDLDAYAKQSSYVPIKGKVRWGWMLSSRGCPFHCLFCSPTLRKSCGQGYRAHSAKYIADVAEKLHDEMGCNALAFEDDVFSLSKARTMAIAEEFIRRGLHEKILWTAQTHAATLDEEMIRAMKKAGCRGLLMGVESGDEEIRRKIKAASLKLETLGRNVAIMKEEGVAVTLYFMIGSPGETLEQMEKTLKLAKRLKPDMIQLAFFTPYPGSQAWEAYMEAYGEEPDLSHYNRFSVNLSAAKREDVLKFYRKFYRSFYLDPKYLTTSLTRRLLYTLSQSGKREWGLVLRSLAFLLLPLRPTRIEAKTIKKLLGIR